MKNYNRLMLTMSLMLFASAVFASHAPPEQKAKCSTLYSDCFISGNADDSADNGFDLLKIAAIMPVDFQTCYVAAQNPTEGLQAYGWEKDKRSRLFMCRNNC